MADYLGDFAQDKTVHVYVRTTVDGVPTAPNSALEAADFRIYKNTSASEKTTTNGVSITSPFDSLTGLHVLVIDTSVDTGDIGFWVGGADYFVVLEPDETLGGVAFGGIVAHFSIENRSAVRPTVADRTLDVTATGGAGIDWANVENPTTTLGLSGTTVKTATDVETDTQDIQARLPAALVSGRIDASVGAMAANVLTATAINADAITAAKIADGAIDAATFAAGAINAAAIAADAITDAKVAADVTIASVTGAVGSVTGAVGSVTGNVGGNVVGSVGSVTGNVGGNVVGSVASVVAGVTLAASAIQAIWDALTSALTTVGSIGKLLVDNINATISSRSSHTAADIWASAARTLTAATNITSTGGTTVPQTGDSFARLGAPVGASISADIATKATPAQVNTEVLDVLVTDTFAEPTSVPAATSSLKDKIAWLFTVGRNKLTQTSTTQKVRNDGDSSDVASSTVSDDGTTFTRGKFS